MTRKIKYFNKPNYCVSLINKISFDVSFKQM